MAKLKRVVLVLGMHRSGTSLITRGLKVLGVALGDKFLDEAPDNEKGFWEDSDVMELNSAILKKLSEHDWHTLTPFSKNQLKEEYFEIYKEQATELLSGKIKNKTILGIKDPRFCRLLPFWDKVLKSLEIEVSYIISIRNPLSVAHSLQKRDGFDFEKSFYLWLSYIIPSIIDSANHQRVVVDYDLMMEQPEKQLGRISKALDLPFNKQQLEEYTKEYITDRLRHTRFQIRDLNSEVKLPGEIIEAYTLLYRAAKDKILISSKELDRTFIKLEQLLTTMEPTLKYIEKLNLKVTRLNQTIKNREILAKDSSQAITEADAQIKHLTQTIRKRDISISSFTQTITNQKEELLRLTQQNIQNKEQLSHFNKIVANHNNQLIELYNSTSWQVTTPLRFASHQLQRAVYAPALIKVAIKRGGGFTPTLKKAIRLYYREGLSGIKHGLRTVARSNYIKLPDTEFLRTINHKAGELLEPRALIIAELSIPQCTKYRVKQKQEMFNELGIDCTVLSWTDANACINELSSHSLAIFYRVPGVPEVLSVIAEAKRLKIPTFWEVDDLIFNEDVLTESKALSILDKEITKELLEGAKLYNTAMLACDSGIASTTGLSAAMQKAGVPEVFVIENALDQQTLSCAKNINKSYPQPTDSVIRIAYGSGTNTHDIDFKEASEAILHVLKSFPNVKLRIIGSLELPKGYAQYESQLEKIPFCSYEEYLNYLAECNINIAPLENYIFNESKSNIKLLEASVLKIPSICSPRSAFSQAITHHKNGFLCETQDEWVDALTSLVTDSELRKRIAMSAYRSALKTYSLANITNQQLLPLANKHHSRREDTKRILSINILYAPRSFGGATIVAEETNKILDTDPNFDLYVFTTLPLSEVSEYAIKRYEIGDICIFGLGLPDTNDHKSQFENPLVLDAFEKVLSAVKPDLVHIHCIQGIGVSIAELCSSKDIKYIVTLHDAWWVCGKQFMINREKKYCNQKKIDLRICDSCVDDATLNRYRQAKLHLTLNNADLLLTPSQFFANFYIKNGFPADKVLVNKNGISRPGIKRKFRRKGPLKFGYVGGNTEVKGVDLVKQSFLDLHEENIKLIIVDNTINLGYHSYDEHFFEGVTDIEIVPAYTQETIDSFFSRIDVLLFPTQCKESFGLTVREATARNVWVITTDAGGVVEDLSQGGNGFIIPFDDKGKAFTRAIKDTIQYYQKFPVGAEINLQKNQITWFEDQATELTKVYERVTRK